MNTLSIRGEKAAISILYFLFTCVTVAIIVEDTLRQSGNFYIDDIILPYGLFFVFTAAQALTYHIGKKWYAGCSSVLAVASVFKCLIVFFFEFMLDRLNIQFFRPEAVLRSTLIVIFLSLIVIIPAVEVIVAVRWKTENTDK